MSPSLCIEPDPQIFILICNHAAAEKGEVPTARAITERLVKIRQLARANGAGHFGISSSQAKSSNGKIGTPKKGITTAGSPCTPVTSQKSKSTAAAHGHANGVIYQNGDIEETTGQRSPSLSPSKRKHDDLNGERNGATFGAAQRRMSVKVESIETDGFEIMDDGSSFHDASRSPASHGSSGSGYGIRGPRMHSVAGNARQISQSQGDISPTKRMRVMDLATQEAHDASSQAWAEKSGQILVRHGLRQITDDDDDDVA